MSAEAIDRLNRRSVLATAGVGLLVGSAASAAQAQSASDGAVNGVSEREPTVLGPGIHRLPGSITVRGDLQLLPGAVIEIPAGRKLTLRGSLQAPLARIFSGQGTVDLNRCGITCAHPEWWGAVPNDENEDCLPALEACLAAHPVTQLRPADYHIKDTFVVQRPYARIIGAGSRGYGPTQGTRIVLANPHADVMRAGPTDQPRKVNDFVWEVELSHINLVRAVPPAAGAVGLRAQFLLYARFERVSAFEHSTGFYLAGMVRSYLIDCFSFRSAAGNDTWRGFHLDGRPNIGLAGGNASLYMLDCLVNIGGSPGLTDPVGFLLQNAFADTFMVRPETAACATGIRVVGEVALLGHRKKSGHADLHLRGVVLDACDVGLEISDTSPWSQIRIEDPYVGLKPGATAAMRIENARGQLSISGGQLLGWPDSDAGGDAVGVEVVGSSMVSIAGTQCLDFRRPMSLENCHSLDIAASIVNPGQRASTAALQLRECRQASVRLMIGGRSGAFSSAVAVTGQETAGILLDLSAVDPSSITGGEANLILVNGAPHASKGANPVALSGH